MFRKKAFDEIQHPLMIKNSQQTRNRNCLYLTKSIYEKPTANITILNGEKPDAFSQRSRTSLGCHLPPLLVNIVLEVLARATGEENEIKDIETGKRKKNCLCLYNPKELTTKLLKISNYSKSTRCKVNIPKLIVFL